MGCVDKLIGWIGRHKTLSALGIASLFGLGLYATNDYVKDKVDSGAKWAKDKVFSKSGGKAVVGAPAVVANASAVATPQVSETPYKFSPDIQIFGSDSYKQKIQSALDEIKRTNITEYNEVMLYIDSLYQNPPPLKDIKEGKGVGGFYIPEDQIYPSGLIHEKEHVKQANIEPFKSYYANKSTWDWELDAVNAQVDWEAEAYKYSDERKQQQIKKYMEYYKDRYPEQYAKWVSDS